MRDITRDLIDRILNREGDDKPNKRGDDAINSELANEALTPAQDKHLDIHDDGKIDKKDFKKLRDMRKNKSDK